MENIKKSIIGLIWSVKQLQKLIPDGKNWDNRAQSIAYNLAFAEKELEFLLCQKYPYVATYRNGQSFVPTQIDYENRLLWHQHGQAAGIGDWVSMDDVTLSPNRYFEL